MTTSFHTNSINNPIHPLDFCKKMTVTHLMNKHDAVNDLGILIIRSSKSLEHVGTKTVSILKFLLYDVTLSLNKLPFGNWVSVIYFLFMTLSIKNVVEGGELNRVLGRAIELYFIQQKSFSECFNRGQHYLWRLAMAQVSEVQSWIYGTFAYAWTYTSSSVKSEVKRFAKEVVLENAEDIEKTIKEFAKTAAFAAMVTTLSNKLVTELGPVAVDALSKSDIAKSAIEQLAITNTNVQSMSSNLAESRGDDILLKQKLAEISMQLEYLRINQPAQFREILQTISLSSLALNDVGLPSTLVDTFAKLTGTLGSSLSQQGQRRIKDI